jgi:predicted alpha/beta superfamily hydrolase
MKIISREMSNETGDAEILVVRSEAAGLDFKVTVAGPGAPLPEGARLDAVFCLDGDLGGGANISAARSNPIGGDQPPLFVVNIGYPIEAGPTAWMVNRVREFSPFRRPDYDPLLERMAPGAPAHGGGKAFLSFLTEELRPLIQQHYPVKPGPVGLVGASMGGFFALYALAAAPHAFDRVLAVSPAIFWGGEDYLRLVEDFVADPATSHARLFVCAGENETRADWKAIIENMPPSPGRDASHAFFSHVGWPDLRQCALDSAAAFARRKGLSARSGVMAKEHHGSVYMPALSQGLRWLYGPQG